MLKSKSTYFQQSNEVLSANRVDLVFLLKLKRFNQAQIDFVLTSYDFFVANPDRYDGATKSQDLEDIKGETGYDGLEIAAMVHDYLYVKLKANLSVFLMRIADEIMEIIMRKFVKSGFEISRRLFLLAIIRRPFALINQIKSKFKSKPDTVGIFNAYIIFNS